MPRHSAPQQPGRLRPRLVVAFVVAAAGLVTAVWLPTRNDSADAAERNRNNDSRRSRVLPAFADDFSGKRGSTVDPGKWSLRTDRNNGVRFSESTRNARLNGDGDLVIVARGEDGGTVSTARLYSRTLRGASGRVEARIKAPAGEGLQPVFELVGTERQRGALNLLAEPISDGQFHTYAVDWQPGRIVFSVDGTPVERETPDGLDTDQPFKVALSLGADREQADLPARMVVDSVSFSGADASAEPTTPPATTPPTKVPSSPPPSSPPPATEEPTVPPTIAPTTAPTTPPTTAPTTAPPATEAPPAPAAWAPFTDYIAGELVTYKGVEYQVLETHTSLPGWEPTALPALFKKI